MAEGLDNDMNQQQQQESVPHGQEAFRTPSVRFENRSLEGTNTPMIQQPASTIQPGASTGHKKKSAFEITSVTEARVHSRGDSNGYDLDELNESDVTEIEIETVDNTTNRNGGNGGSRFKVVKIQRSDPYKRGRWQCHDFSDVEQVTSSTQNSGDSREVHSIHSAAHSSSLASTNINHISVDSNAWTDSSLSNHRDSVDISSSSKQPILAQNLPSAVHVNFEATLRKKDLDHLSTGSKPDPGDLGSFGLSGATAALERADKLYEGTRQISGVIQSSSSVIGEELPIVNTIATAMDQITQIKSALLTVVHEEVQTLKDTIEKLKEENQELKLENEKLKQRVESKPT